MRMEIVLWWLLIGVIRLLLCGELHKTGGGVDVEAASGELMLESINGRAQTLSMVLCR